FTPYPTGNLLPGIPGWWFGLGGNAAIREAIIALLSIRSFFRVLSVCSLARRTKLSASVKTDIFACILWSCTECDLH
ncbi:Os04g0110350, partial [Oryza sativa Japonica Group]